MKRSKTPAGRPESAARRSRRDLASDGQPRRADPGARADAGDGDLDDDLSDLDGEGLRLNKFLAQNGVASRRGADQLIARGKVLVDGQVVTELGTRIDPTTARVEVGGELLRPEGERPRYYLLNKPKGVVCTNDPREARPRAIDLVNDKKRGRIFTVGRLDEDTEGLVILTNDGEFAQRISHPRFGVKKTYWVDVRGRVAEETLTGMKEGVRLSDGWAGFEHVKVVKRSDERSILLVTLGEGKNREVRRVLAALGLPVRTLKRVSIGPLGDRKLKTGQWRFLTKAEVGMLLEPAPAADGPPPRPRFGQRVGSKRPWKRKPLARGGPQRRSGPGTRSRGRAGAGRRHSS